MNSAIACRNLTLGYDRHPAVHHLSGSFALGSLTAITGPNGAGKSTLLKGILGLLPPLGGTIKIADSLQGTISYLPQQTDLEADFPISVWDAVTMGHWRRVGAWRSLGRESHLQTQEALRRVGLQGFERRSVGSLSGGQRQRVLFARLLVEDAALILLDEPFAAIDQRTVNDLLAIVQAWHAQGRTVLAVLHDLEQIRHHFPQCLYLVRHALAWGETDKVLTPELVAHGRVMSESWDESAPYCFVESS
ncbi:zinc ABC transporter ATP-binding protein AztA [Candidatus Magnetaquicoccus inordinatus]|uniref:zinc ABC transporter ATP-binding protein AztA n=1 Tax=Candidatus Magnetaquicoccus inordinatus TaxID=2496818 RepID=UPI00102CA757|nr:zinc ABC transporter ATP-binding protein AztA [Candidatus Magnetaquicoccus inordinatus]